MPSSLDLPPPGDNYVKIFLKSQFLTKSQPLPEDISVAGQTAIITGGNVGLGLECARLLLDRKLSRLILASRNTQKGEGAATALRKTHPAAHVEVWALDMLSYDSIRSFAQRCATLERIDFIILNAGIFSLDFKINKSTGHEEMFQVNYLSTMLLSILLLPILRAKRPQRRPGRLTIVSSGFAYSARFLNKNARPLIPSFDDPKGWNASAASERYAMSKLLEQMFVLKLVDFVSSDDVVVNMVDPGLVRNTQLHRSMGFVKTVMAAMKRLTGRTLEQGASTYVDAAVVKTQDTHGSLVLDWKVSP